MTRKRYGLIDLLRGLAVINMVAYHGLWDLVNIFGVSAPFLASKGGDIWERFICCTFITLSGFCAALPRRPSVKRGVTVLLCGVVVTAVVNCVTPEFPNYFGVLTLLGSAMIIATLCSKGLKRMNHALGLALSLVLFAVTYRLARGYLWLPGRQIALPPALYANMITAYLGMPGRSFVSYDYFPLMPWLFLFLAGFYLCLLMEGLNMTDMLLKPRRSPLNTVGRNALIIYMLHQPVLMALFYGVRYLMSAFGGAK